jgi:hypothetical protein
MILARAAELSVPSSSEAGSSDGLSLLEMKAIAKVVGLDPDFIERAAHLVPGAQRSTPMGRLFGGPLLSQTDIYIPVRLTPEHAQQVLSLVRATLLTQGRGEATASGISFSSLEAGSKVFVSAHFDGGGTRIRVVVDNRSGLVMPTVLASAGAAVTMYVAVGVGNVPGNPSALPHLVMGSGITIVAGRLWSSIRKTVQRTLGTLDNLVDALMGFVRNTDAS